MVTPNGLVAAVRAMLLAEQRDEDTARTIIAFVISNEAAAREVALRLALQRK